MSDEIRKRALELYTPPFTFNSGYIFDNNSQMVADDDGVEGSIVTRIRGWGRISYLENAEDLQDEVGEIVAEALNEYWEKHYE